MMNVHIRDYSPEDWEQIESIIIAAENFGPAFLEHEKMKVQIYDKFPSYGRVLVAENVQDKSILGYAALQFEWRALVISSIITHHNHLRKGVGSQLIEKIKKIGNAHPVADVIRVDTGDFMNYAQKFYASCGFQNVGHVPHYLSWHNDQVIFVYQLKKETTRAKQ